MRSFVDANVWMFAVGGPHPLRDRARDFLRTAVDGPPLVVSAEVLQEVLHRYLRAGREGTLDRCLDLIRGRAELMPVEAGDVLLARDLAVVHPGLDARDLVHLAFCQRRQIENLRTFDRALAEAAGGASPW